MIDEPQFERHPVPPVKEPRKEETVEVSKVQLDKLLDRVERQDKEIAMLKDVADVGRVARWQAQHRTALPKVVRVSRYQDKYVLAWRLTANEVEQNPVTGIWHEKQEVELIFEGNEKVTVPYKHFALNKTMVDTEVIQTTTSPDGNDTMVVEIIDPKDRGKKLTIDVRFVN